MPSRASNVLVGTASWTDPTLIKSGRFYPDDVKTPEQRLRFYAEHFPVVEVDSSYYSLPTVTNSNLWLKRTPPDFVFDFKAFRLFSLHQTPLKAMPRLLRDELQPLVNKNGNLYYPDLPNSIKDELWKSFRQALEPLDAAGKLGYVLLQFPPWVMKRRSNLAHIEECASRLEGISVVVEFRNATWFKEGDARETLAFLREQNLPLVIVDEPQGFGTSIPAIWEATSPDLSVVRFHGRNKENWTKKNITAAERFDYFYSKEELEDLSEKVKMVARESKRAQAIFNNCYEDKARRNATQFMEIFKT
jgi:uncharacterized protein YecE (DUF72 family)